MDIPIMASGFEGRDLKIRPAGVLSGPALLIDGAPAEKEKGEYVLQNNDGKQVTARLRGNVLDPIPHLVFDGHTVHLVRSLRWYEYTWMGLPIPLLLVVDNNGPVGAAFAILGLYISARIFRSGLGTIGKYAMSAAVSLLVTIGCFLYNVVLVRVVTGG